jgi:hypothetical protein
VQLRNGKTSASIPDELRPFAPLAEKWHRLGEDPERCARLARGDSADPDLQELAAFANAWSDQRQAILEDWADRVSPEDAEIVPFFSVT